MATETLTTGRDITDEQARELIMEKKREAAKAATVGDMNAQFKRGVDDLLTHPQSRLPAETPAKPKWEFPSNAGGDGSFSDEGIAPEALKREAKKHVDEMEKASKDKEGIKLMDADPGHLGRNQVGGGDATMELNGDMFARLDGTRTQIEDIDQTKAHESAHGKQVNAPKLWLEGHAEVSSGEAIGKGADFRRAGQPRDLYAEGQTTVVETIHIIGRDKVEQGMTQDFNIIIRELMASEDPAAKAKLQEIAASN